VFQKILVPVDLADPDVSAPAVEAAAAIAKAFSSAIRLIYVLNLPGAFAPMEYVPQIDFDAFIVEDKKRLAEIAERIDLPKDRVSNVVRSGGVYPEILPEAAEWGADLMVVGAHKRSMASYLLGSSAAALVRQAKCSIMIVRSEKPASLI
jgi:nucleotide-binding universal stress UspA family protein